MEKATDYQWWGLHAEAHIKVTFSFSQRQDVEAVSDVSSDDREFFVHFEIKKTVSASIFLVTNIFIR